MVLSVQYARAVVPVSSLDSCSFWVTRYTQTGLIKMLERNNSETFHKSGKLSPERWYDMDKDLRLDIVLTYEARVYDAVLQGR